MPDLVFAAVLSVPIGIMLGLLGGGGSILTVPLLVYGLGLPDKEAIATSLLVVMVTSAVASLPHARNGYVQWRIAGAFAAAAMVGAFGGGWVAQFIPGPVLLLLFAGLMLVTAVAMWRGRANLGAKSDARKPRLTVLLVEGFGVGFVTGLVGAGGGFLVVPALVLLGGLSMRQAVGTSLAVIAAKSLAGFVGYVSHVSVDYQLAMVVIAAAVAGSFVGAALSARVTPARLRRGFALFVAAMGAYILVREIPAQFGTPDGAEETVHQVPSDQVAGHGEQGAG